MFVFSLVGHDLAEYSSVIFLTIYQNVCEVSALETDLSDARSYSVL
jgi:hypothetical protein